MNALPCSFLRSFMVIMVTSLQSHTSVSLGNQAARSKTSPYSWQQTGSNIHPKLLNPAALIITMAATGEGGRQTVAKVRGHCFSLAKCCYRPCVSHAVNRSQTQCIRRQRLWVRHMSRTKRDWSSDADASSMISLLSTPYSGKSLTD